MTTLFPFHPNWSQGVDVTLSFRTDIFRSRSGKEQRRALRSDPRKNVSYTSVTHRDTYRQFLRLMADKQNDTMVLPDPTRFVRISAAVSLGATSITVASVPYWLRAGSIIVLDDGENRAYTTVAGVSGSTISIPGTSRAWPSYTVIRPGLTGLLAQSLPATLATDTTATAKVDFEVDPGSEYYPSTSPGTTVDGIEVFTYPWNWSKEVGVDFAWPIEQVDMGWGVIQNNRPIQFGSETRKIGLLLDYADAHAMQEFFCRAKGQRGVFWLPSGTDDLTAASDIAAGTTLTLSAAETLDDVHTGIAIYRKTGAPIYAKVASIAGTTVTLSSSIAAVPVSNIKRISWMTHARFASDEVTFSYLTDNVVEVSPAMVSLPA